MPKVDECWKADLNRSRAAVVAATPGQYAALLAQAVGDKPLHELRSLLGTRQRRTMARPGQAARDLRKVLRTA